MFDGLDTLFSQNNLTTLHAVLRALNNRKFIYFVTLKLDYSRMKEEQKQAEEEKGGSVLSDMSGRGSWSTQLFLVVAQWHSG